MVVPRIVEIIMASEPPLCKTEYHGAQANAAIEKLVILFMAKAAHMSDRGFPGPHVVIPAPGDAAGNEYRSQIIER